MADWLLPFQTKSVFQMNLFGNRTFLFAISASILSLFGLIYIPFLQTIFQTEALSMDDILMLICLSSTVLVVDEMVKFFYRQLADQSDSDSNKHTHSYEAKKFIP